MLQSQSHFSNLECSMGERKVNVSTTVFSKAVFDDEGESTSTLDGRGVGTGKRKQFITGRGEGSTLGVVSGLAQPCLCQDHHVDVIVTDKVTDGCAFGGGTDGACIEDAEAQLAGDG